MGYCPLVVWCLPLADLHHLRLTKRFPKLPAPSSRLERHLHFASIRLCLPWLFIISILYLNYSTDLSSKCSAHCIVAVGAQCSQNIGGECAPSKKSRKIWIASRLHKIPCKCILNKSCKIGLFSYKLKLTQKGEIKKFYFLLIEPMS